MSWEKEEAKSRHVDFACPVVKSKSNPSLLASAASDPVPHQPAIAAAGQVSPPPVAAVAAAAVNQNPPGHAMPFEPYPHNMPTGDE